MSREKIKAAALELFERYSYVKTSVADIAKASGIGKGTIYLSFKTKEEIFVALLEDSIQKSKAETDPYFLDPAVGIDEKLGQLSQQLLDLHFLIRDLMFGSFENVQGRELHDVYTKLTFFFEGLVAFWVEILRLHGYTGAEANLRESLYELMNFLSGRFLSYILSHDWNNRDEIRRIMPAWAKKLFHAFIGEPS